MAPRTASTAVAVAIVSLLLRIMADPFFNQDFHLVPGSGTAYHTRILDPPKRSFFSGTLLLPLPSAKFHPPEKPDTENCFFSVTSTSWSPDFVGAFSGIRECGVFCVCATQRHTRRLRFAGGSLYREVSSG